MRWFLLFIGLCLALTVLRAAIVALLIVLALSLLWGAFFRPAETFGFVALLLFGAVLQTHTIAVLLLIGFLAFVTRFRWEKVEPTPTAPAVPLLTHVPDSSSLDS